MSSNGLLLPGLTLTFEIESIDEQTGNVDIEVYTKW